MGTRSLLQGIFPTEGSKPGLPHCRRILYQLSHKGSPRILERVAYPFLSGSPQPRNRAGASCIQADSLPAELSGLYRRAWLAHTLPPRFSSECQEGSERGPARVSPSDTQQSAVSPCTSTRPSCLCCCSVWRGLRWLSSCRISHSALHHPTRLHRHHQADSRCHRGPPGMRARGSPLRRRRPQLPSSAALGCLRACWSALGLHAGFLLPHLS